MNINEVSEIDFSLVVPVFNEEECLPEVLKELKAALGETDLATWEVILVDDGSTDRSVKVIKGQTADDDRFRVIRLVRNAGQTAALDIGFQAARGRIVGMMDGDEQNDPRDFPRLIEALDRTGVDMMCGVRQKRQDSLVRRVSSRIANSVRNRVTRETVTDVGCSIRVFRRECLGEIKLYNGMHRFFPTLFRIEGYRIAEIPVNHRPRVRGRSKYGVGNRLWRGIVDLFAVRWMQARVLRYQVRQD